MCAGPPLHYEQNGSLSLPSIGEPSAALVTCPSQETCSSPPTPSRLWGPWNHRAGSLRSEPCSSSWFLRWTQTRRVWEGEGYGKVACEHWLLTFLSNIVYFSMTFLKIFHSNMVKDCADAFGSPFFVVEGHGSIRLVVGRYPEGDDLHGGEAWRHGEDLAPVGGLIQVLFGLRVRHSCGIPTYDVKVGSCDHSCPAVPLHLKREWTTYRRVSRQTGNSMYDEYTVE